MCGMCEEKDLDCKSDWERRLPSSMDLKQNSRRLQVSKQCKCVLIPKSPVHVLPHGF